MEQEIGKVFIHNGVKLKVEVGRCIDCYFSCGWPCGKELFSYSREGNFIHYVEAKEEDEIKIIDIPEGFELDRIENNELILKRKK